MNAQRAHRPEAAADLRERVSALLDGEADDIDRSDLFRGLLADADGRSAWTEYTLVGDAIRSADLARRPDDAFVLAVRERLAREPVVLAPLTISPSRVTRRWQAPVAVAAGVTMVLGTLWVVLPRASSSGAGQAVMASASAAPAAAAATPNTAATLRDAELDRYLAAHTQFSGAGALGVPSGFLRASTLDTQPGQ